MATIRVTPDELRDAATFLGDRLEAINGEVQSLKTKIDDIVSEWEGAAQNSFIDSFENDMYPILRDTLPQVIEGIQGQLTGVADTLEEADNKISEAFKG